MGPESGDRLGLPKRSSDPGEIICRLLAFFAERIRGTQPSILLSHNQGERAIGRSTRENGIGTKEPAERIDYADVPLAQAFVDACQERNGARRFRRA